MALRKVQKGQLQDHEAYFDVDARTPPKGVHDGGHTSPHSMCTPQSRLDGVPEDTGTKGEKLSRRGGRRLRRMAARLRKREERCREVGNMSDVFTFHDLYAAGKKCCKNVRWKQSVQMFEVRLFSGTAVRRRNLMNGTYKFSSYTHFLLSERGKIRPIDAPRIGDRQVEKVFTNKVLLPLYLPSMIHNNGASQKGKGFHFSQARLRREMAAHFRKYGRKGGIILADGRKFFPTANHDKIYERHTRFILQDDLRRFGDGVIETVKAGYGMPLGVEPSQAEMIAYPSDMDNYMKCQMGLHGYGHYMDDFYAIVPPDKDWREIMNAMRQQAQRCGFTLSSNKTRYVPFTRPFRYCKIGYRFTETGHIVARGSRTSVPRARKKILAFYRMRLPEEDVAASMNGVMAYLQCYDEHWRVLRLRRMLYSLFGGVA